MVHTCVFCGVKFRAGNGRTFHSFPLKQPEIFRSWLNAMQLGENFLPKKGMKLCSDHFEKECLKKPCVNVTLAESSILTLFGIPKSACVYRRAIKKPGDTRTFHSFPHKNAQFLAKWIANLGSENCIVGPRSSLCSEHFEKSCFRPFGHSHGQLLRLRDAAVPTIFVPTTSEERLGLEIAKQTGSSEELPAAKRLHAESDSTVDVVISSPLNQTPESQTRRRVQLTQHDHHYEDTPRTIKNKLSATNQILQKMKGERRVYKQKINPLQKKVRSLKDIVSELRKARAISEAGLAYLDSIADEDISEFLKRYINNKKNVSKETPAAKKKTME
ncbi:THAP domain-containing protein 1-like [Neodiprion lecontei]|uniref:THAP domain-containing protein 1-like n=1 Tax=Neodiprion lecontei TaxID=441921 RepID=A0ABM3FSF7_NEOLC|nr:THAP domain-containing protein 1-like [Neodiprion lecontei]